MMAVSTAGFGKRNKPFGQLFTITWTYVLKVLFFSNVRQGIKCNLPIISSYAIGIEYQVSNSYFKFLHFLCIIDLYVAIIVADWDEHIFYVAQ